VGSLVNRNAEGDAALGGVPYATFIAPGLLATTAMMLGANEAMWPVFGGFKWNRVYHAMAATPMTIEGIVLGQLAWIAIRMAGAATAVSCVMLLFADTRSTGLPLAIGFATLCGLAFVAPIMAYSAGARAENGNSFATLSRFVITPLFLFGGAFFPLSQLPAAIRPIAQVTPLWHGVELSRDAVLHRLELVDTAGHLAFLLTWIVVGALVAERRFRKQLTT
jgi:lipooligosaccharide transport system permease protein